MTSLRVLIGSLATGVLALSAIPAMAGSFLAASDSLFSYAGTVTRESDGQAFAIPSFVSTPDNALYAGRDLALYMGNAAPAALSTPAIPVFPDATVFETNWFGNATVPNGSGNPNNTNVGFIQLNDLDDITPASKSGGWTDAAYKTLVITVTGSNAGSDAAAQLWPADSVSESPNILDGTFQSYTLVLTLTFADAATETLPGWFATEEAPVSVTGSFSGIFLNQNQEDPSLTGLYDFDFGIILQNWAHNNQLADELNYFGAQAVPEPPAVALLGTALLGLCGIRRRARR